MMTVRVRPRLWPVSAALAIALATPVTAAPGAAPANVLSGQWGGDQFSLQIVSDAAIVQGKCTVGKFPTPVRIDADGRFTSSGYYNPVTPGYRLSEVAPRDRPARLTGRVRGQALEITLTVETGAGAPLVESHRLRRNQTVRFTDCRGLKPGIG